MDSFYYYAPVTRVRKLKKILNRAGIKPTKLLVQEHLIRPNFILNMLRFWLEGSAKPAGILLSVIRSKRFDVVKLSRDREIGEERIAFLDFLVFILRGDAQETERKLRGGICPSGSTVKLGSEVRERLRKLVGGDMSALKDFTPPATYQRKLARLCSKFMVCRACKVLGVDYPQSVVEVPFVFKGKGNGRLRNFIEQEVRECAEFCELGDHWEDVGRAASLLNYVETHKELVYVATVATIYPMKASNECFSRIVKVLAHKWKNIKVLTPA